MNIFKNTFLFLILLLACQTVFAVNFSLFGDVRLSTSDVDGESSGFALGDLDFYATQDISDNTRAFVELVFESTSSGIVTDLERIWIMRRFSEELNLSAGRFHSPLGRWNRTYHHGSLVQDTVTRPFFLDFEDGNTGILPVHIVGAMLTGDLISDKDEFNYELAIGNGPSLNSEGGFSPTTKPEIEINTTSDNNSNKTIALRVIYGQDQYPVKVGLFAMSHEIAESGTSSVLAAIGSTLVEQTIVGTDLLYSADPFDVLFEYYYFINKDKIGDNVTHNANAWFLQFSYQIIDELKLIIREESLRFDKASDGYFLLLGTEQANHHVMGLRYDLDESNAIKLELNIADNDISPDTSTITVQWAFLLP
ncbi:MAG: hypothetical protein ACC657_04135 [Thiohalomonadales bacterium]